jgi:hypothetical protein
LILTLSTRGAVICGIPGIDAFGTEDFMAADVTATLRFIWDQFTQAALLFLCFLLILTLRRVELGDFALSE